MTTKKTKRAALSVALAMALVGAPSVVSTAWAQISPGFANTVQQTLQTQRQAQNAAAAPRKLLWGEEYEKTVKESWGKGRVEGLFIAVQDYDALEKLRGCANDADNLRSWFETTYGDRGSATTLSDVATKSLTTVETPSRANILKALDEKAAVECKRLIVTFAGHGVNYGGKSFFCPSDVKGTSFAGVDANAEDTRSVLDKGISNNLIAVEDVLTRLKKAKAEEVVVIFDACRDNDGADNFTREFITLLTSDGAGYDRPNGGFFVLTSCSTGEYAHETTGADGKKYGAFTYYFVEGLKGKADAAECCDGFVTLNEAYNYTRAKLSDKQSPEFFMATKQMANMPTLSRVAFEKNPTEGGGERASLTEVDRWSDLEFLVSAGRVLCDSRLTPKPQRVGERTMSVALDVAPNNTTAWELRGSVRRSLGDYRGALSDWEKVGWKLQLYVKTKREARGNIPAGAIVATEKDQWNLFDLLNDAGQPTGAKIESHDLATVEKFDGDWAWVSEMNDVPLGDKAGWIKVENLTWHYTIVENMIRASKEQRARSEQINKASMIDGGGNTPGPNPYIPGGITPK